MRLKKILIISVSTILVASPFLALAYINLFPKTNSLNRRYIVEDELTKARQKELKDALDETIQNNNLTFKFYTLTRTEQYTPSQLSWFTEFDTALKSLDSRLGFELIPRTNQTVESGFRNRNGEMISMFWSPDYHNIGTWIGFHFYPNYPTPNLWNNLYSYLTSGEGENLPKHDPKYGPAGTVLDVNQWGAALKTYLDGVSNRYPSSDLESLPSMEDPKIQVKTSLFQSSEKLTELDMAAVKAGLTGNHIGARETVSNEIGIWADMNNELAVGLLNWMDHEVTALPWIMQGPTTTVNSLVRNGYHIPFNNYSGETFRDWYYEASKPGIGEKFRWWIPTDPFATNKTPYNASFNDASNNIFFQTTYNGLVDWKIVGDWKHENDSWTPPEHSFFMSGASKIDFYPNETSTAPSYSEVRALLKNREIDNLKTEYVNALTSSKKVTFTIEPEFPWNGPNGPIVQDGNPIMLQAQDYFWGFMGYLLSSNWGINTNAYYMGLMNLDIDKTIKANSQFYDLVPTAADVLEKFPGAPTEAYVPKVNVDPNANKEFTVVLTKPNINLLDIFSKQYLQPLPIHNAKVKNIFALQQRPELFSPNGSIQTSKMDFNTLYGAGEKKGNYVDWWSAGPYYISGVSEQDITFKLNPTYFDVLGKGTGMPMDNQPFGDLEKYPRIKEVNMKYAGAFSDQLTYIQFKENEIDRSKIPSAYITEAATTLKDDFKSEGVSIVPRTDLLPFNNNVYEFEKTRKIGDEIVDVSNFMIPDKKKLKSLISPEYEKAIIEDFDKGSAGNSWKIRNAIVQSIDWFSLSALAYPDNSPSYQQSLVPFGNFRGVRGNLTDITAPGFINKPSYFETAAYNSEVGFLRRPIDAYLKNWESQWAQKK
ncbi:MAG: MG321/MPN456 family lipoprotein [Mycoplasmoidaceae bacterium]